MTKILLWLQTTPGARRAIAASLVAVAAGLKYLGIDIEAVVGVPVAWLEAGAKAFDVVAFLTLIWSIVAARRKSAA
jgi:hypothetical protein